MKELIKRNIPPKDSVLDYIINPDYPEYANNLNNLVEEKIFKNY